MAFLEKVSIVENPTVFLLGGNPAALGEDRALIFDTVLSESATFSSTISKFPISDGATITDHIIKNNTTFQFRCTITDSPHEEYANNAITKEENPVGSGLYGKLRKFRTDAAYRTLVSIREASKLFTIVTSHATYPNCAIKNMVLNTGTSALLDITLTIERLRVVTTEKALTTPTLVSKKVNDDLKNTEPAGQGKTTPAGGITGAGGVLESLRQAGADVDAFRAEE